MMDEPKNETRISLSLSGGGSRAIAFHLGCLRALNKLGILDKVQVISCVSGGSVIGAIYSYKNLPFPEFEKYIIALLKKGLTKSIIWEFAKPTFFIPSLVNNFLFFVVELLIILLKLCLFVITKISGGDHKSIFNKLHNPVMRKYTRTYAFEKSLDRLFGGKKIYDTRRHDINVVLNSCELQTGTAFRFGSKESGCWRFGKIVNNEVRLSTAVAASAAFPILLPAIDRKWNLLGRDGQLNSKRLFLADGGVYDNLGVSCLEPGKSALFSYNAYPSNYIICCNAGQGQFTGDSFPAWWPTRIINSFLSVFRKVQDSYADKLHTYKKTDLISGFIYSYLGQQDNVLPYKPENFVDRDSVKNYPTDFSKMLKQNIDWIAKRGEQLTELLVKYYHPELLN